MSIEGELIWTLHVYWRGINIRVLLCHCFYWTDNTVSKVPHTKKPSHKESSFKDTDRPKVSFDPYVEKHTPEPGKQKQNEFPKQARHAARGHFTPNPSKNSIQTKSHVQDLHTNFPLITHFWMSFFNVFQAQDHSHSSALINIRPPSPWRSGLNLSDPSNPILHPPRLTYCSFNKAAGGSGLLDQTKRVGRNLHSFTHSLYLCKRFLKVFLITSAYF